MHRNCMSNVWQLSICLGKTDNRKHVNTAEHQIKQLASSNTLFIFDVTLIFLACLNLPLSGTNFLHFWNMFLIESYQGGQCCIVMYCLSTTILKTCLNLNYKMKSISLIIYYPWKGQQAPSKLHEKWCCYSKVRQCFKRKFKLYHKCKVVLVCT